MLIISYLLVVALFSYILADLMKIKKFWAFIFLFIFNTIIIIVGPIFSILLYFYISREKKEVGELKIHKLDLPQLTLSYPIVNKLYGEGPLENLLRDKEVLEDRKVKILSYITSQLQSDDMRLIHSTLSSKSDESRLLCFGTINQIEKRLNDQINYNLNAIENCKDNSIINVYEKEIAHLYWEFIYYQLVSKDLQGFYLENAKTFAFKALDSDYDKVELYFLLGKINLKMNLYDEAEDALVKTVQNRYLRESALPYLMQLYFEKRDFKKFREILDEMQSIEYTPKILIMRSLWSKK